MAAKYWYVAGNGSAAWSVAANWYNGSGGTGGTSGIPTVIDDVIVDENSGSGTLTIGGTSSCNSLNTELFTGTLAGIYSLIINTTDISINRGIVFNLGANSTYTGIITFISSLPDTLGFVMSTFHKGGMIINGTSNWYGDLTITGTLTLTAGNLFGGEAYVGALSISNANVRTFQYVNLYLSGTGTLIAGSTQTNLSFVANAIYMTSNSSLAKSLTLTLSVCTGNIYLQGYGSGSTSITTSSNVIINPIIEISKTGGGTLIIGTSTLLGLTFIEGTDISWSSTSTLTLLGDLILCDSMSIITSNSILVAGNCSIITFNKVFTGTLVLNESISGYAALYVIGDYSSTSISSAAINLLLGSEAIFYGTVSVGGTLSISNCSAVSIFGSTTAGAVSINSPFSNASCNFGFISASTMSITDASVFIIGGATIINTLTFNSYGMVLSGGTYNIGNFVSSTSATRDLTLIDCTINLTGIGVVWNTSSNVNLNYNFFPTIINVINSSVSGVTFAGGGLVYDTLKFDRGSSIGTCTISGNNSFRNFIDVGTSTHSILFTAGSTQSVGHFGVTGSNTGIITLNSTNTAAFNLFKSPGLVNCDYLNIQHSVATPANTWYAGTNSVNNQGIATVGSGWIFSNMGTRKLGALGVG